jgi:hypothetical protein
LKRRLNMDGENLDNPIKGEELKKQEMESGEQ